MKCPICNQEVQPLDHQERWGPEFAHSRCIIAFNAGSAVQDSKLQTRIKRLENAGDEVVYWFSPMAKHQLTSLHLAALNQWNAAKETKP